MADEKFLCRVVKNSPCSMQVGHPVAYESRPLGGARWRVTILLLRWKVPLDKAAKEGQLEKSSVNSADTLEGS